MSTCDDITLNDALDDMCQEGDLATAKLLVRLGARGYLSDPTILMSAIEAENEDIAKFLIQLGALKAFDSNDLQIMLQVVVESGQMTLYDYIVAQGVVPGPSVATAVARTGWSD